ncbi:MFS transporter [Nitrospirillum viridazoti]|uniref:FSR family fosmidomycin resistance protein-like MFS transporter n=1 Tax=Nitrospirillum amazonense TaxID=28077 RepID=A0A560INA0_9PROT|nr:FSR family fosmidomycin resistance protein-like MFS transporter [Nitrospirillum amazonense]
MSQAESVGASAPSPVVQTAMGQIGAKAGGTVFSVLGAISFCHLLNDMMQSMLPAIYPILKDSFDLSFSQVGLVTLVYQITASLLQPLIGLYTDAKPKPYSLSIGMGFTLVGLVLLATAPSFPLVLVAAALVGTGSSVFHPESSRVARMASGGRHGLAQSLFQVGGNAGSALGPLLAAFIIVPHGRGSIAWFSLTAFLGMIVLAKIGLWYKRNAKPKAAKAVKEDLTGLTPRQVSLAFAILLALIFSKYVYLASITSYFTFYLIQTFGLSVKAAQLHLFIFLGAAAVGTIAGGPIGDRFGRKHVIWWSILGVLPFTLILPYANLFWISVLSGVIGVCLASAFPAIVVYAQELMPGKVGTVAGLFFGLAFGVAGVAAAALGWLADLTSITTVYKICAYLPALGILTVFLPDIEGAMKRARRAG